MTACAVFDASRFQKDVIVSARNFYGVIRVKEYGTPGESYHLRRLVHNWPAAGWERAEVNFSYRYTLLRAIATGHFLRRATGANR